MTHIRDDRAEPSVQPGWAVETVWPEPLPETGARPEVRGKFLRVGGAPWIVRGITYGTFRPLEDGSEYPVQAVVRSDFETMAANGINAVRTYTPPPRWVLDLAAAVGLRILVGIPAERFVGKLDDDGGQAEVDAMVRDAVRGCTAHRAVLAYCVGNELPASLVRFYGQRRITGYLRDLVRVVKREDPGVLVTYANYPSTEYLDLSFLDFLSFNVYLEDEQKLSGYLARLQNIAGDKPLLMTEVGLDSLRNGEGTQARSLGRQLGASFRAGCAGTFAYSWTDEWYRSGEDVHDWAFGMTRRDRAPKPALASLHRAYECAPFPRDVAWPSISVVVCSYNGARTIGECLAAMHELDYPDFEVLVVDDGSTDDTAAIATGAGFRVIAEGRHGLSGARNIGLRAAKGEIIAYTDDDAYPDPNWLRYLALAFSESDHAAVGGPNLAPPTDGDVALCIDHAPGNPVHVLLTDREAEHIPGCNMAFRRERLEAIGGFDERFQIAGDDVDVCWRLRDCGWTIGFHPGAYVWHHRRDTVRTFWRQQKNYGAAESDLEAKYPERYNSVGHPTWSGRVYGQRLVPLLRGFPRIYHGVWGRAPFQSLYAPHADGLSLLPLCPEWFLMASFLAGISLLGFVWPPLFWALPALVLSLCASFVQAVRGGWKVAVPEGSSVQRSMALRGLTIFLHLMQPLARLRGRLGAGLTPWRQRIGGFAWPWRREVAIWTEDGQSLEGWLSAIEDSLRAQRLPVARGDDYSRWDLAVSSGPLGSARLLLGLEEHGQGRQFARFRVLPRVSGKALILLTIGTVAALAALSSGAWILAAVLAAGTTLIFLRGILEVGSSMRAFLAQLSPALALRESACEEDVILPRNGHPESHSEPHPETDTRVEQQPFSRLS